MSDTPETDIEERMAYSQEYIVPTEFARKLERERDEALEKIKRQAERIRILEGATNHAGGLYK